MLNLLPYKNLIIGLVATAFLGFLAYKIEKYGYGRSESKWLAKEQQRKEAEAKAQAAQTEKQNTLTVELLKREQTINQLEKDKRDALSKVTTGRTCFNAGTVRLLNNGLRLPDNQPNIAPENASGIAADSGSTDSQVAEWVATAQSLYSTCAGRLNALIDATEFK